MGRRSRQPATWLAGGASISLIGLLAAVTVYLAVLRHDTFHTTFFDTGTYVQLVWNLAHGRWFLWSHNPPIYLGDHFSLLLTVLAPLFWFVPDARTLQVVGMLSLTSSLVPGYLILRAKHPSLGPLFVLGMAFNMQLHAAATQDIQTILLTAPTVGVAVYALHTSRYRLMVAALVLTLLAREDMPIYVGSFGLFLFLFRPNQRRLGLAIGAVAVAWFVATTMVFMPALYQGSYRHTDQAEGMLSTVLGAAAIFMASPQEALPLFLGSNFARGLVCVFLPLAALPLLAGGHVLLWAPSLLILLLSPEADGFGVGQSWRIAPLLPLWFSSAALVISSLDQRRALLATLAVVACSLVSFGLWSQFPGGGRYAWYLYDVDGRTETMKSLVSRIPPDIAVAATSRLGGQLGARERHYLFPFFSTQNPPDLAIVDASGGDLFPMRSPRQQMDAVEELRLDPAVKAIWRQDDILVFSFTDRSPFSHNYGVPMFYYQEALTKAHALLAMAPGSTLYLRAAADVADRVQQIGQASGLPARVSSSDAALLLAPDSDGDHLYVVPGDDDLAIERLQALGFSELTGERIWLPGGQQSLGFYRLQGRASARLAEALPQEGPDVRLNNGLRLWRWQASGDARGQRTLPLLVAWEVWGSLKPLGMEEDYCVSQHLVDVSSKTLAVADAAFEPTRFLRQGDVLITWPQLPLAADLDLQQAWVQAGMFGCWQRETAVAVDGTGKPAPSGLRIGPFKVGGPDRTSPADKPAYPVQAVLGDAVRLIGYDVLAQPAADQNGIRLQLQWLAEARPLADYTVFIQLLRDGRVVAQQDGPPLGGRYPTSAWDKGETVLDPRALLPAAPLAPGDYQLIAGMYTPGDIRRLPVKQPARSTPADFVDLGTVTVVADGSLSFIPSRGG